MATPDVLSALRARVLGHPEDLDALRVYADGLLEAGDQLGAYLARVLQADAGTVDPPPEVADRLLGRLESAVEAWTFEFGLLRRVRLRALSAREFRQLVGLPEWEGVTHLAVTTQRRRRRVTPGAAWVLPIVQHEVCRHLRELDGIGFDTFTALGDVERTFDRLRVVDVPTWEVSTRLARSCLTVRHLELERDGAETLHAVLGWLKTWGRAVFDRVEHLSLRAFELDPAQAIDRAGARLREVTTPTWRALREERGWAFDFHGYDGLRVTTREQLDWYVRWCVHHVRAMAPLATSIAVTLPVNASEELQQLREAAGGVELRVTEVPPVAERRKPTLPAPEGPEPADDIPF